MLQLPAGHRIYAYDLEALLERLDLLTSHVTDPNETISSVVGDIQSGLVGGIDRLEDLWYLSHELDSERRPRYPGLSKDHKTATLAKFRKQVKRLIRTRSTGIFVDSLGEAECLLGREIKTLRGGQAMVVDVAKLTDDEQTMVFGDILRTVYDIKAGDEEVETVSPTRSSSSSTN